MATVNADGLVTSKSISGPFGENIEGGQIPNNTAEGASWSYLGGFQKNTDAEFAIMPIQMSVRVYIAQLGRFLQVDPVEGGTDNAYAYVNDPVNDYDLNGQWSIGGFIKNIVKTVTRAVTKIAVATVKAVVRVATRVATVTSYVARAVVAPAIAKVVSVAKSVGSAVGSAAKSATRATVSFTAKYGDAISLSATVLGIGVCAATAGVGCAIMAGAAVAVDAGVQAAGSLAFDLSTLGVGRVAKYNLGAGRIGEAAIDMNGAPVAFGIGMYIESKIDQACDAPGGMC